MLLNWRCQCGSWQVRFANALRGGGTNFTVTETQPESISLELKDGSKWRKVLFLQRDCEIALAM